MSRLIDSHHHLWDLGVRPQPWLDQTGLEPLRRNFLPGDFAAVAAAAGVTASVVVQTVVEPEETPELLAIAADSELIAGVVGWVDLTAAEVADRLAELAELAGGLKLAGIRHQVQSEPGPDWLTRPDVLRGLAAVARAGLVYDLVITAGQLPSASAAAAAVPDLVFVLDHLGKPPVADAALGPWAADLRRFAALPNTVGKLSGLVTEAGGGGWAVADLRPFAEVALDGFGAGRLMFGSDWPVCTVVASYDEVLAAARELTASLSAAERGAIFGGTATRIYGLDALQGLHPDERALVGWPAGRRDAQRDRARHQDARDDRRQGDGERDGRRDDEDRDQQEHPGDRPRYGGAANAGGPSP